MSLPSRGKGSIVVCATLYGHPPRFDEWLKYQKTLGVDMVHLSVETSFYHEIYPSLKEFLDSGFVKIEIWKDIVGERLFYHGQNYQDCIFRHMGIGLLCDYDDFFIPLVPTHKDIHYYLDKFFWQS